MLKTQRFSSLFRHYAKYHGLRKDELEYYFVNLLENEDTPESVHLQRGDTIMVRKRRKAAPPEPAADDDEYFKDLRDLMGDEEHMDCVFLIRSGESDSDAGSAKSDPHAGAKTSASKAKGGASKDKPGATTSSALLEAGDVGGGVRAHKSILTARGEYFRALFRKAHFVEATTCIISVDPNFAYEHVRYVLEFLYTNRIQDLRYVPTDDLLCLLHLSDKWMIRDLKRIVEHELIRHMSVDTVARMYGATEDFNAPRLARACIEFIMGNLRQLAGNAKFEEDMKNYPLLCIPVLKAAADLIPDQSHHQGHTASKKQRLDHGGGQQHTPSSNSRLGSSPVPDSDA
jgi:hypothetical protein